MVRRLARASPLTLRNLVVNVTSTSHLTTEPHTTSFTKPIAKMAEPAEDIEDHTSTATSPTSSKPRNAFVELMAPKPKPPPSLSQPKFSKGGNPFKGRGALLEYIQHPERFPNEALRVTPHTVLIRDLYPKATVHLLLLPRSPAHHDLHPHDAFQDPDFLATIRAEAASAADLAAAELSRKLSRFSASSKARNDALDAGDYDNAPPGRDYRKEIRIGIHAHPSMTHLHVHIFSRDMHSECVKHRKHYNSFNTPFLIPLEVYPLAEEDNLRSVQFQNGNLHAGFVCWRCGEGFGNRFAELKRHLEGEFVEWRAE